MKNSLLLANMDISDVKIPRRQHEYSPKTGRNRVEIEVRPHRYEALALGIADIATAKPGTARKRPKNADFTEH